MNMQPELDLVPYLKLMVDKQASDLFLSVGAPPNLKLEGLTYPLGATTTCARVRSRHLPTAS
jgi:Tfp pilus assembly ATPase PilU